jgi:protein TonB
LEPKKNPKVDLERKRSIFFLVGLFVSLSLVYIAINFRFYEANANNGLGQAFEDIEEEIIPITQQNTPPPPPPPPPPPAAPEVLEIVEDDQEVEDVTMEDTEADENTIVEELPEEEPEQVEQIFTIVEDMPTFKGCEKEKDAQARQMCTQQKIFEFLNKEMKYPQMAKEAGISGTVFVNFVIGPDGNVKDIKVLRGVPGGKMLDEEAIRVIKKLPPFNPGKQRGKPVSVSYNLPVRFILR